MEYVLIQKLHPRLISLEEQAPGPRAQGTQATCPGSSTFSDLGDLGRGQPLGRLLGQRRRRLQAIGDRSRAKAFLVNLQLCERPKMGRVKTL